MPSADPVAEALETLQRLEAEQQPVRDDDGPQPANLAETLAVVAAIVRGADEPEEVWCEAVLQFAKPSRASMIEARRVLAALGYREISDVLSRMIRSAPRKPPYIKARELKKAERRKALMASHRTRH